MDIDPNTDELIFGAIQFFGRIFRNSEADVESWVPDRSPVWQCRGAFLQ